MAKKNFNRIFFRIFNDKGMGRRLLFSAALAAAPAVYISHQFVSEKPSSEAPAQSAETVKAYRAEIKQLYSDAPKAVFSINAKPQSLTADETQKIKEVKQRGSALLDRLILDAGISEAQAQDILNEYRKELKPLMTEKEFIDAHFSAAFIQECKVGGNTEAVRDCLKSESDDNFKIMLFTSLLLQSLVFTPIANTLLRKSRRKNEQNLIDEEKEDFEDAKGDLKKLLEPKSLKKGPQP